MKKFSTRNVITPAATATVATLVGLLSTVAPAATVYWDTNGAVTGLGGTGAWQNAGDGWTSDINGETATVGWVNANLDTADFRGAAGAVSVTAPVVAAGVVFHSGGYELGGDAITFTTGVATGGTVVNLNAGTGTTTIGNDLNIVNDAAVTGSASYTFINATTGTLNVDGDVTLGFTTGTPSGTKTFSINNTNAAGVTNLNGSFSAGPGSSTSRISITGPGTVHLDAANGFDTGNAMDNGTLYLGDNGALGTGALAVGTSGSTSTTMTVLAKGARTITNNMETKGSASVAITIGGSTADLTTYSGQFKISQHSSAVVDLTAAAGGRVNFTGQFITGNRSMEKVGAGIVAFSGNNNSSSAGAAVTVSAGTLLLNNTSASSSAMGPSATFAVGPAGTLGGTGYAATAVTANAATSTFSPGEMTLAGVSSIESLDLTGGLTAASGATFKYDVNGASSDVINLGVGALDLDGTAIFALTNLGSVGTGTPYTLLTGTGDWTASTPTFLFVAPVGYVLDTTYGTGGYVWNPGSNALSVQFAEFAAVPEPATVGLLAAGAVALLGRRRRHA